MCPPIPMPLVFAWARSSRTLPALLRSASVCSPQGMEDPESSAWETLSSPYGYPTLEADSVTFGFYTLDEMRRLSVKQVTTAVQHDASDAR